MTFAETLLIIPEEADQVVFPPLAWKTLGIIICLEKQILND